MKVELCPESGSVFIKAENEEDVKQIYEFIVENDEFKEEFRMKFYPRHEQRGDEEPYTQLKPLLIFTCEAEGKE